MRTSPLAEIHEELGAMLTDFAGWRLPVRFASDLAEHHAVRRAAGIFDLSHMAQLFIAGSHAEQGLDRALSAWHSTMAPGQAAYSLLLADDGGALDDLIVYRLDEARWLVVANAANRETVRRELADRLSACGTEVEDATKRRSLIAVQGPLSGAILAELGLGEVVETLPYYAIAGAAMAANGVEVDALVARTGYTGEDGFELSVAAQDAPGLWRAISKAGSGHGLLPAGLACRDTLRLEAGMPLYGHELTRETTPLEAGLKRFVGLDKPVFTGREALLDSPPRRRLVALAGEGRRAARAGCPVLVDGQVRGSVTSGALSPTLGHPIALAYIDLPAPEPGDAVAVDVRGTPQPFTVVRRPFYRRAKAT